MQIPALQHASSSTPPEHSIYVNFSLALQDLAPLVDWAGVFYRICYYFEPFHVHLATFPYQTRPQSIHEVEIVWECTLPGTPATADGATDPNAWLLQTDFRRCKSYVWLRKVTGNGQLPNPLAEPRIADRIAHEAVHNLVGPRHVQPSDGKPGLPGTSWLMAADMDEKPKILDNLSIKSLLARLGPKR